MLLENWNFWGKAFFLFSHIQSVVTLPAGINSSVFPRREQEKEDKKNSVAQISEYKENTPLLFWVTLYP